MLETAKIVKADFYVSKKGVSLIETLELEIEIADQEETKIILANGRFLIDAVHKTITLKNIPVGQATIEEYVSELEGLPIRVDIVDNKVVAILHHLRKYVVFVKNGEVTF